MPLLLCFQDHGFQESGCALLGRTEYALVVCTMLFFPFVAVFTAIYIENAENLRSSARSARSVRRDDQPNQQTQRVVVELAPVSDNREGAGPPLPVGAPGVGTASHVILSANSETFGRGESDEGTGSEMASTSERRSSR